MCITNTDGSIRGAPQCVTSGSVDQTLARGRSPPRWPAAEKRPAYADFRNVLCPCSLYQLSSGSHDAKVVDLAKDAVPEECRLI